MSLNLILRCYQRVKTHSACFQFLCYFFILSSCGFIFGNDIDIYIKYEMTDKNIVFNGITAYIGGTKDASYYDQPLASDRLYLNPVAERVETLIFVYRVQNQQYYWEKLKIEPKKKYTMEMIFNKPDQFQYRICQRPCAIKKASWSQATAYKSP